MVSGVYSFIFSEGAPLRRIADTRMTAFPNGPNFHFFFTVSFEGRVAAFTANVKCGEFFKCGIFVARDDGRNWTVERVVGACHEDPGVQFDGFGDAVLKGDTLAFVAQTVDGQEGIYKVNTSDLTLKTERVVWTGQSTPNRKMGNFAQFPQPPAIHNGELLFRAYTTSGDTGIYLADFKGGITELLTTQDTLEGNRQVVYMGSAENALADNGTYVFYASTLNATGKDAYDGVYLGHHKQR